MKKSRRLVAALAAILFLVLIFMEIFDLIGGPEATLHGCKLNDGWQVVVHETEYLNADLNELQFELTDAGDILTMERKLPNALPDGAVMSFYSVHTVVKVYVADELIYESGQDAYDNGTLLGYGYHFITLPEAAEGKMLQIELCVAEEDAFTNLDVPVIEEGSHIVRNFLMERRVTIAVSLFLIVFGTIFIIAAIFFSFEGPDFYRLLCLALFSLSIGLWNFCNYDLITLITYNMKAKAYIEFSAIYGAPTFLFGYFYDEATKGGGKLQKYVYYALMGSQIMFVASASALQAFGIVHFPAMLKYNHILMGAMIIYLVVIFARSAWVHQKKHYILLIGMAIMGAFAARDIISYNIQMYFGGFEGGHFKSMTYLGIFIFVLALIVDFVTKISNSLYVVAKNETLEKMAYTDALTGLLNRRRCEEIFDEIDKEKSDYVVIAMDLNNLKKVNDSLGHDIGDVYICEFAKVLQKAFAEYGAVIRIGGDEFLVVVREAAQIDVKKQIEEMNRLLEEVNHNHTNWHMSTAYGVCYASEDSERTVRAANKEADARMYEKKREMKGIK